MQYCHQCNKTITRKDDANILAFLGLVPHVFCNSCYASKERGFLRHFLYTPRAPINSKIYFWGMVGATIIFTMMGLIALFSDQIGNISRTIGIFFIILFIVWGWTLRALANNKINNLK